MKDNEKREKGKYIKVYTKEENGVVYKKIETTVVGNDFEVLSFSNEYIPGLVFPLRWG